MAHVDLAYLEKTALHTFSFLLQPASWARFAYPNPLVWETVQFTKANRAHVPRKDGVYGFLVRFGSPWGTHPPAYLMYIGETGRTLWERYGEYLRESEGKGKTRPALSRMFQLFPDDLFFTYAVTPPGEAFSVEQQLIKAFWPPLNDQLPAELRPAQKALRR